MHLIGGVYLHTVEVTGSIPVPPTMKIKGLRSHFAALLLLWRLCYFQCKFSLNLGARGELGGVYGGADEFQSSGRSCDVKVR